MYNGRGAPAGTAASQGAMSASELHREVPGRPPSRMRRNSPHSSAPYVAQCAAGNDLLLRAEQEDLVRGRRKQRRIGRGVDRRTAGVGNPAHARRQQLAGANLATP